MSIRRRKWVTKGKEQVAWVVDYFDAKGKRHIKTFATKKDAKDWQAETRMGVKRGTHIADSASVTVAEAGKLWIETCEHGTGTHEPLTRGSTDRNRQHVELHIKPFLGNTKLSRLTVSAVRNFEEQLLSDGRSPALVRMVITSLGSLIADAIERDLAALNPVRDMRSQRRKRRTKGTKVRKAKLMVGVDIPTPAEVRAILTAARPDSNSGGTFRLAFFATAALAGLRSSELRALRWQDVDFKKKTVSVWQRADAWGEIDQTKSEAGERTVPVSDLVINALREWKLECPQRDTGKKDAAGKPVTELHYVFPNGAGNINSHQNIVQREWHPLLEAAGITAPRFHKRGALKGKPIMAFDEKGNPILDGNGDHVQVMAAKYSGLHALRHFFCSWCAARKEDSGLGLPLKTVQVRMGHSTLAMTADRYGHLFPSTDDSDVLAAGERALMGA